MLGSVRAARRAENLAAHDGSRCAGFDDAEAHITKLRGSKLWQIGVLALWLQTHDAPVKPARVEVAA